MEKRKFKIYCLKHPITLEIRYIGVTCRDLKQRLSQHYHSGNLTTLSTPVSKWVKSLRKVELKPHIELIEEVLEVDWQKKEKYYIDLFKKTHRLLNISLGGSGIIVGKTRKEANIASIEAHKKKVCQFTLDNKLIKIWDSIKEATAAHSNKKSTGISNAANNQYRAVSAFEYKWQLYENYLKKEPLKSHILDEEKGQKNCIEVHLFNNKGAYLKSFHSISSAADFLGIYTSRIHYVLNSQKLLMKKYFISKDKNFSLTKII